jgi:endogenous inhibitor of DNA gyrase (YacG/DUF329 family)
MARCPVCKQSVTPEGNTFRPFCSERCKMIDLDNWLEGRYRVPVVAAEDDEGDGLAEQVPEPEEDSE